MNHEAGNQPRTTALLTAVSLTPTAAAIFLRPKASANVFACLSIGDKKPHLVDSNKSTIGGLPKNPQKAIQYPMGKDDSQFYDIAQRLTAIRRGFSDLNQKEFASKHGFNPTQWNNWEAGQRRIPIEASERMCKIYGLTLDFIYMGRRDGLSEKASKVL